MAEEKGAFFNEFVQGGLLDDVDVKIQTARFVKWDYKGKFAPTLALQLMLEDSEGNVHDDYLSSGELRFFVPSTDGKRAIPVGSSQSLNLNTNAVAFILSVMNADTRGELAAKIKGTDDISVLDGLKFHMVRKDQPKRPGIQAPPVPGEAPAAPERVKQRVECAKIIAYPWETGTSGATTAPTKPATTAAAPTPAATASATTGNGGAGSAVAVEAVGLLAQLVATAGGTLNKKMIAGQVFSNPDFKAKDVALRNGILGLIVKPEFLAGPDLATVGLKYDPATESVSF